MPLPDFSSFGEPVEAASAHPRAPRIAPARVDPDAQRTYDAMRRDGQIDRSAPLGSHQHPYVAQDRDMLAALASNPDRRGHWAIAPSGALVQLGTGEPVVGRAPAPRPGPPRAVGSLDFSAQADPVRSNAARIGQNFQDAAMTNPLPSLARERVVNPFGNISIPGLEAFENASANGLMGSLQRQIERTVDRSPAFGSVMLAGRAAGALLGPDDRHRIEQFERERRADYQRAAQADPWYRVPGDWWDKAQAGGATLLGQLGGSATDPTNFAGPGKAAGVGGFVRNAIAEGGVNAAGDVVAQASDLNAGLADQYDARRTAASAAVGAGLHAAGRGVEAGTRAVRDAASRLELPDLSSLIPTTPKGRARPGPPAGRADFSNDAEPVDPRSIAPDFEPQGRSFGESPAPAAHAPKPGTTEVVRTPQGGANVETRFRVVERDALTTSHDLDLADNPNFPGELQPRDRTRAASETQVTGIARDLDPALLGHDPRGDGGAPIIGPDGIVESGNARTIAIGRAYQQNSARAEGYRNWLREGGWPVDGMREPVLVRERVTELPPQARAAWASALNERATAAMSPAEQARADAGRLNLDVLDGYKGGGLGRPENSEFVRKAINAIVPQSEFGGVANAGGRLSAQGEARLRAAIIQKAYDSTDLVSRLFEDPRPEIGTIGRAMTEAAPHWAAMRELDNAGRAEKGFEATAQLLDAVNLVRDSRAKGRPLAEVFASDDLVGRDPRVQQFVRLMHTDDSLTRLRSQAAIRRSLELYAIAGRSSDVGSMFDGDGRALSDSVLDGLVRSAHQDASRGLADEPDTFAAASPRPGPPVGRAPRRGGLLAAQARPDALGALGPLRAPTARPGPPRLSRNNAAPDFSGGAELASASGLRHAPTLGAVPASARTGDYAGHTVSGIADKLKRALDATHRQGRMFMRGKGVLGTYHTKSGVVRTRAMQELDVLSHELGHALEGLKIPALLGALKSFARDLRPLAYPGAPDRVKRQEGFAEFARWYVTNPDHARKVAAPFYDAFERALEKDRPDLLTALREAQAAYTELRSTPSMDVATASLVWPSKERGLEAFVGEAKRTTVGEAVRGLMDRVYRDYVDKLHPVQMATRDLLAIAERNTGRRFDLPTAENPYRLARMSAEAHTAGVMDVRHGVRPYHGVDPEGAALADAVAKAMGGKWSDARLDEFGAYLVSRRMVREWDNYGSGNLDRPPDKFSKAFHAQTIKDFEAANPEWRDAAAMVYEWNNNLWRKQFEGGLLTKGTYEHGLAMEDHVPLQRDMSDRDRVGKGTGQGNQYAGGAKRFRGSTRDVINPIHSLLLKAQHVASLLERNDVFKALDDLSQRAGPGGGGIVERLPASETRAVTVNVIDALERAAKESGMSPRDAADLIDSAATLLEGSEMATVFKAGEINARGEPIVFVWRDGKKTPLRLPDGEYGRSLFESLMGLQEEPRGLFADALALPSQTLRAGVTLSPEYQARNLIRDQLSASILTDVGFKPFWTAGRGLFDAIANTDFARRYYTFGGLRGGASTASLKQAQVTTDLRRLTDKGYRVRQMASWRGLVEFTELSEKSTRIGVFRLAYEKAKRQGLSDHEAAKQAAYEARDYLDFERHGSRMVWSRRAFTFLNTGIQGLDKLRRVLTAEGNLKGVVAPFAKGAIQNPSERRAVIHAWKAHVALAALGLIGAQQALTYRDDPEYQEINEYLRATHWIVKAGGEWVFIPKPFELAVYSNIAERLLERDSKKVDRMVRGVAQVLVPPHDIPALAVPFQIAANRDHDGKPIVPDHLRGTVDPELQFGAYTSQLAKFLGRKLHVSPAVIDHVITGTTGSMGRYATQGADKVIQIATGEGPPQRAMGLEDAPLTRSFVREPSRGSRSQGEFWDLMGRDGQLTQREGTFRRLAAEGDPRQAYEYLATLKPFERAWVLSQYGGPQGFGKIHPLARARASNSVISDLRRDIAGGEINGMRGDPIRLSPQQRRDVDTALSRLQMVEMRNGLIGARVPGHEGEAMMPRRDAMEALNRASPPVAALLAQRLRIEKVPDARAAGAFWDRTRDKLEAVPSEETLSRAVTSKRLKSNDRLDRIEEANRLRAERAASQPMTARVNSLVQQIAPGARPTSGYRTPEHNAEVGGVANSYHTRDGGRALDLVPPQGMSMGELHRRLRASGLRWKECINEGDHVHVAW